MRNLFCPRFALFLALALALLVPAGSAFAQETIHWTADELSYDEEAEIVTAEGDVEVEYRGNTLEADRIVYDRNTGIVTAYGNIRLIDDRGDIAVAESLELSDDLREGVIEGIRVFLAGGEQLAASRADRSDGNRNTFHFAVYSPCRICEDERGGEPLWQIRAERVVHNEDERTLTYRNATLELLGLPILYTPWLQHPDMTVDRASGFLTPDFGSSSILGFTMEIPYYFNLARNKDLTVAPLLTTDERAALLFEYRHRVANGSFEFSGSGTYVSDRDFQNNRLPGNEFRGHLFGEGRFDMDGGWGWGFDVEVASDDTFLRRYDFSRADSLVNRLFIEKIDGRNYFNASAYAFQGLRAEDDAGTTPIAAPYIRYSHVSPPSWLGGHFTADASMLMLTRTDGLDTGRGSVNATWQIPYTSPFGELYKLTVGLRGDVYYLRDTPAAGQPDVTLGDDFEARGIPYIALDWKLPFIRRGESSQQILEPIIQIVASPTGVNDMDIPNEDSISFDYDITNLFRIDRFAGLDLWEPGARVAYGLKFTQFTDSGTRASIQVGQSYRFSEEEVMPEDSGLREKLSDVVIGASISVPGAFLYEHRIRLDKDNFSIRRNEGALLFGPEDYRFSIGYTELNRNGLDPLLRDREEVRTAARIKLSQYWFASADFSYDFAAQGGVLTTGGAVTYEDECFRFQLRARRDFTSDREVRPETSIGFQLVFKAVGDNTQ